MLGKSLLGLIAAATALAASPLRAQDVDKYADGWTEERRGDRDWKQRATEQLTSGPVDRFFGPSADGAVKGILDRIIGHVEGMYEQRRHPCLAAAVNQAHTQTLVIGRQEVMRGATDMLFSAAGGAAGGRNLAEALGQRLFDQIKDKLTEQALDKFKSEMRDRMKAGSPVYYRSSDSRGNCTTAFRLVWDKSAERYEFLFAGDCQCDAVSCGKQGGTARLRRWTLTGWGTVVPQIDQLQDGSKRISFAIGLPRDVTLTADCCGQGDNRFRMQPATGAGNAWVGFTPPRAQPPVQPDRPQTGGTPAAGTGTATPQSGTTPAPAPAIRPRPARIEVPVVPDRPMTEAELEALGEQVSATYERAQFANQEAVRRLDELEEQGASAEDIREAEGDVEATEDIRKRTRAALDQVLEKFNEQQSSVPPDRESAQALALHNQVRADAGVPALRWDRELAASADAYAEHLANGVPYVHAGRIGREDQRENLSMGYRGSSAVAMMQNWISEKRNFKPGVFPDVSLTGDWEDAGHYSQMIWPTTTRVGCGTARGAQWEYLVCRYSPPGNRDGSQVP